jgi:hypothetical protein
LPEVSELLKNLNNGIKKESDQEPPKKDISSPNVKKTRGLDKLKKIIDGFDS